VVADCHNILASWSNYVYFSQILNAQGANDFRQTEIHGEEPVVPEPSAVNVELATEKLKSHKSQGIDQIPAELIKSAGRTICCEIHKLTTSIWNKEKLPEEWKQLITIPIYKQADKTYCSNYHITLAKDIQNFNHRPAL
jgi:hypothetical protein